MQQHSKRRALRLVRDSRQQLPLMSGRSSWMRWSSSSCLAKVFVWLMCAVHASLAQLDCAKPSSFIGRTYRVCCPASALWRACTCKICASPVSVACSVILTVGAENWRPLRSTPVLGAYQLMMQHLWPPQEISQTGMIPSVPMTSPVSQYGMQVSHNTVGMQVSPHTLAYQSSTVAPEVAPAGMCMAVLQPRQRRGHLHSHQ